MSMIFYLLTIRVMLKRNQRQELLLEQNPHFFLAPIQEINASMWIIKFPSSLLFLLVFVWVSKGGRISCFLHRWGMSMCSALKGLHWRVCTCSALKGPGGTGPLSERWQVSIPHGLAACLWRLQHCLGKGGEGMTSLVYSVELLGCIAERNGI